MAARNGREAHVTTTGTPSVSMARSGSATPRLHVREGGHCSGHQLRTGGGLGAWLPRDGCPKGDNVAVHSIHVLVPLGAEGLSSRLQVYGDGD